MHGLMTVDRVGPTIDGTHCSSTQLGHYNYHIRNNAFSIFDNVKIISGIFINQLCLLVLLAHHQQNYGYANLIPRFELKISQSPEYADLQILWNP